MASSVGLERPTVASLPKEILRCLNATIMSAGEFSPFNDGDVRLIEPLLKPAQIVGVKLLAGLTRPNVIIVEVVEGELSPFVDKFLTICDAVRVGRDLPRQRL